MKRKPRAAKPRTVELAARLSITQSAELHRTLLDVCGSGAPLILDGGAVEEIDTAVLQLLVSAWLGSEKRGSERRWLGVSAPLRRAAALIGVDGALEVDGLQPSPSV